MWTQFWNYLRAIGGYWWAVAAIFVALERYTERLAPDFWNKHIDPWFTARRRKQVLIGIFFTAFVVANFLAFDDQANQVAQLRSQRQITAEPERDPDALYQLGELVATTIGGKIDRGNSTVTFEAIKNEGKLDVQSDVEYRNLVLSCSGLPRSPPNGAIMGAFHGVAVGGIRCTILRVR